MARSDHQRQEGAGVALTPDLFGGMSLLREWGRIGTQGRHRIDCFEDAGRAADAMVTLYRAKQKRGYQLAG
jgi:predicted DNA-binding WGR domain protein